MSVEGVLIERFKLIGGRLPTEVEIDRLQSLMRALGSLGGDDPIVAVVIAEIAAAERLSKAADQAAARIQSAASQACDPVGQRAAAELTKQLQQQLNKEAGGILRHLASQAAAAAPAVAASRYLLAVGILGLVLLTAVIAGWMGLTIGAGGSISSPYLRAYIEAGNDPSALAPPADCKSAGLGGPSGSGSCWVSIRRAASSPTIPAEGASPIVLLPPSLQVLGLAALIIGLLAASRWAWRMGGWFGAAGAVAGLAGTMGLLTLLPPSMWAAIWRIWS